MKSFDYRWWGRFIWVISLCTVVHATVLLLWYGFSVPEIERLFCYTWKGKEVWINLPIAISGWLAVLVGPLFIAVLVMIANFKPDERGKRPVLDYLGWMGFNFLLSLAIKIFISDDVGFFMTYVWCTTLWFLMYRRWLIKFIVRVITAMLRLLFPRRLGF